MVILNGFIEWAYKLTEALYSRSNTLPTVTTLLRPNASTDSHSLYFSPSQDDCIGTERSKNDHGGSPVYQTRSIGH